MDSCTRALAAVGLAVHASDDELVMDVAGELVFQAASRIDRWGHLAATIGTLAAAIVAVRSMDPLDGARLHAYLADLDTIPDEAARAHAIRISTS